MALTETKAEKAAPRDSVYYLADRDGLYLWVRPTGAKAWYARTGKENGKGLSWKKIADWPATSLEDARIECALYLRSLKTPEPKTATFQEVAERWLAMRADAGKGHSDKKSVYRLAAHVYPFIGNITMRELSNGYAYITNMLTRLADRCETARRVRALCGQIFRYAISLDLCDRNPCDNQYIMNAVPAPTPKHYATLTDEDEIGDLLRRINSYEQYRTRCALMFASLTFCRPGEIRRAEWAEIDFEKKIWAIPAEKMKMKSAHRVPLAPQAITLLAAMRDRTGGGRYVFPSMRPSREQRPMSENTLRAALHSLGYVNEKGETTMTAHGFRAMASTLLNEQGFRPDIVEKQLAHEERNKVRAAYNRADYWEERVKMMAWYANHLDELRGAPMNLK